MSITTNKMLEWAGALFGILGNILLALNLPESKWAFALFVPSNAFLIAYALRTKSHGLNAMYITYTVITFIGIFRWIIT